MAKKETLVETLQGGPGCEVKILFFEIWEGFFGERLCTRFFPSAFFRPSIGDLFKGVKSDLHLGDQKLTNGRRW